jgi:hypothetical protein
VEILREDNSIYDEGDLYEWSLAVAPVKGDNVLRLNLEARVTYVNLRWLHFHSVTGKVSFEGEAAGMLVHGVFEG